MPANPLLDNSPEKRIAELEGRLARLEGQGTSSTSLPAAKIGTLRWSIDMPSQLTGLVVNEGVELLLNGATVTSAAYPLLAEKYAAAGFTVGTTFVLPDCIGRVPVCLGTHTDVNQIGKDDGVAVANRTPFHGTTAGTTSSLTAGTPTGSVSGPFVYQVNTAADTAIGGASARVTSIASSLNPVFGGAPLPPHSHTVTVGLTGSRPFDTPAFSVIGVVYVRAL